MASLKDVSASVKCRKELNIDLDFDDLVTQITCKTCNLFALANMASNFKLGIALKDSESFSFHVKSSMHMTGKLGLNPQTLERVTENGFD